MKRLLVVAILLLCAPLQAETLTAVLTPNHEVPPTTSSGNGSATVTVDATRTIATVVVNVANLGSPIVGSHIHKAPFGTNGGIVLDLVHTNFANGRLTGTFTIAPALGADLVANPAAYYVNVHTTQFPGGAVRGQLSLSSGVTMFGGELRGSNEVPPSGVPNVGAFLVWFDAAKTTISWSVDTGGVASPTLAHIHKAAAGTNGGIVINLATSASAFVNGEIKGSIAVPDTALVADIIANPQNYYVNVHTSANPGGALRGQLSAVNEYDIGVTGKVSGALGTNFVTDLRVFNPSFTSPAAVLLEYFPGPGNTTAAAMIALNVPARATSVVNDTGGSSGFNLTGVGGVRVTSASPLVVTSRIFNDLRPVDGGTFGQFVPAIKRSALPLNGALPQLSAHALVSSGFQVGFRTNVGHFNPNPSDTVIRYELRDSDGVIVGTAVAIAGPLSHTQQGIGALFPTVDFTDRPNLTLTYSASAPVAVYASVVDNTTSDQYYVVPQEDPFTNAN